MALIALDIDSTLHHYWDLISRIAMERYGVSLPYEDQHGWGIESLEHDEIRAIVQETHSEANILNAEPYPHAVETVRTWHAEGHWIHVTSHRHDETHATTAQWLDRIGMPYDDLHCSYDKVTRCVELGIDVLVDDSPVNLENAREHGILGATIIHPWNTELIDGETIIGGSDWRELQERLEPVLQAKAAA